MIEKAIKDIVERKDLSEKEASEVMNDIMSGKATDAQISAFLVAMRMKGEKYTEITGFARSMREKSIKISPDVKGLVDTCGTGGDRIKTFNISTASMFVIAGTGIPIAKHGNRSVTSKAGSADVLEALGVNIHRKPKEVERMIEKIGIGFMFAPQFHPAMKYAMPVRKTLKIRTVFNLLGPLTNPAGAKNQVIGVYAPEFLKKIAYSLKELGTEHSFVVHGDGMDEITTLGKTIVAEIKEDIVFYEYSPEDFGIKRSRLKDLAGLNAEENARIIYDILNGKKGPKRDIVIANAALGIIAGGKAENIKEAVRIAEDSIDSGKAFEKLEKFVKESGDISIFEKFGE